MSQKVPLQSVQVYGRKVRCFVAVSDLNLICYMSSSELHYQLIAQCVITAVASVYWVVHATLKCAQNKRLTAFHSKIMRTVENFCAEFYF